MERKKVEGKKREPKKVFRVPKSNNVPRIVKCGDGKRLLTL